MAGNTGERRLVRVQSGGGVDVSVGQVIDAGHVADPKRRTRKPEQAPSPSDSPVSPSGVVVTISS